MYRDNKRIMLMLITTLLLFSSLVSGDLLARNCLESKISTARPILSAPASQEWNRIGSGLIGSNVLYFFDDDEFWRMPNAVKNLKLSRIVTLRFPGGELSDNYDWKTHALERPNLWPREPDSDDGRSLRTDYLEFLAHSEAVGTKDLFFVVNVDGAFRAGGDISKNLELYAEKAAEWVRVIKNSGHTVKYWEIGNEPNLIGFPLTAEEYANALEIFSRKMRAADNTILIGAAGPKGFKGRGFGDLIGPDALRAVRSSGRSAKQHCSGLKWNRCIKKLRGGQKLTDPRKAWWPTLLEHAGDSFDFAAIHSYRRFDFNTVNERSLHNVTKRLRNLKNTLEKTKGKPVPVALTEWNTPNNKRHAPSTEMGHLLNIAFQLGINASAGIDFAHYWPMRTDNDGFRPLLSRDARPTAVAKFFAEIGELLGESEVAQTILTDGLYLLSIRRNGSHGYLVVNFGTENFQVGLSGMVGHMAKVVRVTGNPDGKVLPFDICKEVVPSEEQSRVEVPGQSVVIVSVQ